jgi:hypothetical protein
LVSGMEELLGIMPAQRDVGESEECKYKTN